MRVSSLHWRTFRLPFRVWFATSHGIRVYREGVILQLRTDGGIVGLGEAAPISEGNQSSLQEVMAIFEAIRPSLLGKRLNEVERALNVSRASWEQRALAAVRCALDVAVCDVMAQTAGITVAEFLVPGASRQVSVNATIGAPKTADAYAATLEARKMGFGCVKLKVGITDSVDAECERVAAVRDALGQDGQLRLDANGVWTIEQAICTIQALEAYNLEFVEQPIGPGDLNGLKRVRAAVQTPIAADEDVTSPDAARRVLQLEAAQVLVLKPMVVGGLQPARRIVELAEAAGVSVVVTTTIDAGVGTAAALHLAATLPPGGPACGLATGSLLTADLITRPLEPHNGHMELPHKPGLGVEIDEREFGQYGGRN